MSQTYSPISADWPCQVTPPGTPDWERTAARWLRDLLPARYAGYSTLTRHPLLLARHARLQLQNEIRAVRAALQTCRTELPSLGFTETMIESTIKLYATELAQLNRLAQGVRLITDALVKESRRAPVTVRRRTPVAARR
ncbi:hypothetical protein ABVG11_08740 [Streptomyces sp. HD1123-B1]|uniref:hypothetical protein n=1 Tax=Streptomyces TaxID=1883 RepID=UPI0020C8905C|nr:hypothetical protein [Streptomyces sp. NEAU-Y11]MCP9205967.1 hypothetical protein [Streptomyces sp. NEAU-Y11]